MARNLDRSPFSSERSPPLVDAGRHNGHRPLVQMFLRMRRDLFNKEDLQIYIYMYIFIAVSRFAFDCTIMTTIKELLPIITVFFLFSLISAKCGLFSISFESPWLLPPFAFTIVIELVRRVYLSVLILRTVDAPSLKMANCGQWRTSWGVSELCRTIDGLQTEPLLLKLLLFMEIVLAVLYVFLFLNILSVFLHFLTKPVIDCEEENNIVTVTPHWNELSEQEWTDRNFPFYFNRQFEMVHPAHNTDSPPPYLSALRELPSLSDSANRTLPPRYSQLEFELNSTVAKSFVWRNDI